MNNGNGQSPAGGNSLTGGASSRGGSAGGSSPTEGDRQIRREFQAQREAAERLRQSVAGEGVDTRALDQAIQQLRDLEGGRYLGNPQGVEQLQAQVVAGVREFEYALWRRFKGMDTAPALGARGQPPAEYQQMVEEYYRRLARQGTGNKPPDR